MNASTKLEGIQDTVLGNRIVTLDNGAVLSLAGVKVVWNGGTIQQLMDASLKSLVIRAQGPLRSMTTERAQSIIDGWKRDGIRVEALGTRQASAPVTVVREMTEDELAQAALNNEAIMARVLEMHEKRLAGLA